MMLKTMSPQAFSCDLGSPITISLDLFFTAWDGLIPSPTLPDSFQDRARGSILLLPPTLRRQVTGSLAGYFMIRVFRGYFRFLEELKQQLCSVDFDRTRSQCCEEAHQNGQLCDRKIVKACVAKWFGSQRAFEECIRSEVMGTIVSWF